MRPKLPLLQQARGDQGEIGRAQQILPVGRAGAQQIGQRLQEDFFAR